MSSIMERWFPSVEEEQEREREQDHAKASERERIREFLEIGYMSDFRRWLKDKRREAEPRVGAHTDMIYQSGLRDGMRLVEDQLDELERVLGGNDV